MHAARWSRAKVDAENGRTGGSIFRAAISSARNERTSRLWARAALFEHAAAPRQARAAPVEHPAPPGWLELHPSSILGFWGRLERHPSSILRLRGKLDWHFPNILRLRAGSSGNFEPSAAPGRARAAISSHLRLRARLERPYATNSGISSQAGHEKPSAPRGQRRSKLYEWIY